MLQHYRTLAGCYSTNWFSAILGLIQCGVGALEHWREFIESQGHFSWLLLDRCSTDWQLVGWMRNIQLITE